MMDGWLKESTKFHAGTFPDVCDGDWSQCAHYTQMIWPTTTNVGCGLAPGGGFNWLVCRYSPGGNKDGKPVGQAPVLAANNVVTTVEKPKPVRYQWIDVKTGKPVPSGPIVDIKAYPDGTSVFSKDLPPSGTGILPDQGDPNHAFDAASGRNFVRDPATGAWQDAATGKPVPSGPIIDIKAYPGGTSVFSKDLPPSGTGILPDQSDPNHAFDAKGGRNFAKVPVPSAQSASAATPK